MSGSRQDGEPFLPGAEEHPLRVGQGSASGGCCQECLVVPLQRSGWFRAEEVDEDGPDDRQGGPVVHGWRFRVMATSRLWAAIEMTRVTTQSASLIAPRPGMRTALSRSSSLSLATVSREI
jgi:hypothetical protein